MTLQERNQSDRGLLQFCQQELHRLSEGADPGTASAYAVRYYTAHLEQDQAEFEQFDAIVCREWLQAHRAINGSDETFLSDISRAWDRAEQLIDTVQGDDQQAGELIGRLFRYALVTSSLQSLSRSIPSELLVALVTANPDRWTPQWAIEQARRHTDRAAALAALAPQLPEDERTRVLGEALSAAQTISHEASRARALAELAPQLPEPLLGEALSAAQTISDEDSRARVLTALAPQLPEDERTRVLGEALSAAQTISDGYSRAGALAALAPQLPEDERTRVLGEALSAAQTISDGYLRASSLAAQLSVVSAYFRRILVRKLLRVGAGSIATESTFWNALGQLIASEGAAACSSAATSLIEMTDWFASV
jgi:hypothetical protein